MWGEGVCHARTPISSTCAGVAIDKIPERRHFYKYGSPADEDVPLPISTLENSEYLLQTMFAESKSDTSSPLPSAVEAKSANDLESQPNGRCDDTKESISAFKGLGWVDRFLAVWIFLAMVIGILLGNFVPETGPALQKGKFVGVSVPIGMYSVL